MFHSANLGGQMAGTGTEGQSLLCHAANSPPEVLIGEDVMVEAGTEKNEVVCAGRGTLSRGPVDAAVALITEAIEPVATGLEKSVR